MGWAELNGLREEEKKRRKELSIRKRQIKRQKELSIRERQKANFRSTCSVRDLKEIRGGLRRIGSEGLKQSSPAPSTHRSPLPQPAFLLLLHSIFIIPLRFFKEQMKCHVSTFFLLHLRDTQRLTLEMQGEREKTSVCVRMVSSQFALAPHRSLDPRHVSLLKGLRSRAEPSPGTKKLVKDTAP